MGSNVREGGTFPVTCSNLGQLSPYNLKTLYGHFTQNFDRNIQITETYETFSEYIWNLRNFLVLVGLLEREKTNYDESCFPVPISTVQPSSYPVPVLVYV